MLIGWHTLNYPCIPWMTNTGLWWMIFFNVLTMFGQQLLYQYSLKTLVCGFVLWFCYQDNAGLFLNSCLKELLPLEYFRIIAIGFSLNWRGHTVKEKYWYHGFWQPVLLKWPQYSKFFLDSITSKTQSFHRIRKDNSKICIGWSWEIPKTWSHPEHLGKSRRHHAAQLSIVSEVYKSH